MGGARAGGKIWCSKISHTEPGERADEDGRCCRKEWEASASVTGNELQDQTGREGGGLQCERQVSVGSIRGEVARGGE